MNKLLSIPAAVLLFLSLAQTAHAQIVQATPGQAPPLHTASLGSTGLDDGDISGLSGGTVYNANSQPIPFPQPAQPVYEDNYATMAPVLGNTMTFSFNPGVTWVHFLWGIPDLLYTITLTSHLGEVLIFDPAHAPGASLRTLDWKLDGQGPVLFASGDSRIFDLYFRTLLQGDYFDTITFTNTGSPDPMWVANFQVNSVPEAGVWAMMILGFGACGGALRRRRAAFRSDAAAMRAA